MRLPLYQQKKLASQEILNQIHLLKFWHPKGDRPIIPNRRWKPQLKEFQKILANPQIF